MQKFAITNYNIPSAFKTSLTAVYVVVVDFTLNVLSRFLKAYFCELFIGNIYVVRCGFDMMWLFCDVAVM